MKNEGIKSLLGQIHSSLEPHSDCPDADLFASYADGGLSEQEHQEMSSHIADCDYCMVRLGALSRAHEADAEVAVPDWVRGRARRLVPGGPTQPPARRRTSRWATAAALFLAFGLVFTAGGLRWVTGVGQEPATLASGERQTRTIAPLSSGPSLLWPREGIILDPVGHEFSWTAIPDCLFYDLRIVSDEGDLIWQERVTQTHWSFPTALPLQEGSEYFVRVDAWLNDSKSLNSNYVLFRYGDRR